MLRVPTSKPARVALNAVSIRPHGLLERPHARDLGDHAEVGRARLRLGPTRDAVEILAGSPSFGIPSAPSARSRVETSTGFRCRAVSIQASALAGSGTSNGRSLDDAPQLADGLTDDVAQGRLRCAERALRRQRIRSRLIETGPAFPLRL